MQPTLYTKLAKRLPRFLYKWLAKRWVDYDFPRHLFIELNNSCNLKCDFCPRPDKNEEMRYGLFERIVDEASLYGNRSISLHLFGEPLLYKRICDAMGYLKKNGHTVLLTTNGTLLNKFSDTFMHSGPDRIIWTWRNNNFSDQTVKLLEKKGIVRVLDNQITEDDKKRLGGCKFEYKNTHNYGGYIKSSLTTPNRYPCYHLWLAPAIRCNGDFTLCCNDPHGKLVVGNVNTSSVHKLWSSIAISQYRKDHLDGVYTNICSKCNVWSTYPSIF